MTKAPAESMPDTSVAIQKKAQSSARTLDAGRIRTQG